MFSPGSENFNNLRAYILVMVWALSSHGKVYSNTDGNVYIARR